MWPAGCAARQRPVLRLPGTARRARCGGASGCRRPRRPGLRCSQGPGRRPTDGRRHRGTRSGPRRAVPRVGQTLQRVPVRPAGAASLQVPDGAHAQPRLFGQLILGQPGRPAAGPQPAGEGSGRFGRPRRHRAASRSFLAPRTSNPARRGDPTRHDCGEEMTTPPEAHAASTLGRPSPGQGACHSERLRERRAKPVISSRQVIGRGGTVSPAR